MFFKNNTDSVKILPFVRLFFIVFALGLSYAIYKPLSYDEPPLFIVLLCLYVPIVIVITLIADFFITSFIHSIGIDKDTIVIKYGNGYLYKNILLNKENIKTFKIVSNPVKKWYHTGKGGRTRTTYDTFLNIYLNDGREIIVKDNFSGIYLFNLFSSIKEYIPNIQLETSIPSETLPEDIIKIIESLK